MRSSSRSPFYIPQPPPRIAFGQRFGALPSRTTTDITSEEVKAQAGGYTVPTWKYADKASAIAPAALAERNDAGYTTGWPSEWSYGYFNRVASRALISAQVYWVTLSDGTTNETMGRAKTDITRDDVENYIHGTGASPYVYKYATETDAIAAGISAAAVSLGYGSRTILSTAEWNNLIATALTISQNYYVLLIRRAAF